jgi:hypothetical protein
MHATFAYGPEMEVATLRVGLASTYSPQSTAFAVEAQAAGIDLTSPKQVAAFCNEKIAKENIQIETYIQEFQSEWTPIEERATETFQRMFKTDWDPGEVTAYLSLGTRCPYNTEKRYYFVSIAKNPPTPIGTSLHELMHFYAHTVLEPLFKEAGKLEGFGDFKEALTVLLNSEFADVMDREDMGYPQHKDLREWIRSNYQGNSLIGLTKEHIAQL